MSLDLSTLSSVFAKIARSVENLEEAKKRFSNRLTSGDFRVSMELSADAIEYVWRFHAPKGADFTDVSVCVGDCIHNLRSALDHLVYVIAVHESGKNPPPDEGVLQFPISTTRRAFKNAKNRIYTLSLKVQKAIEEVQPYNRTIGGQPSPLGMLAKFDDIDKHRLLQLVAVMPHSMKFGKLEEGMKITTGEWAKVGLRDGAVIITASFGSPKPDFKGTVEGSVSLALHHEFPPLYSGVTELERLMRTLGAEVEAVVKLVANAAGAGFR